MILVDTSVWIGHLRVGHPGLVELLVNGQVLAHPAVIGELALGNLRNRSEILGRLNRLPRAGVASDQEVLALVETRELFGRGIGSVDAHLLAATLLTPDARFWTLDRRLFSVADDCGISFEPPG